MSAKEDGYVRRINCICNKGKSESESESLYFKLRGKLKV